MNEAQIAARHGLFPSDLRRVGRTRLPLTDERAERAKRRMVKRWEEVPAREWEACRQAGAYRPRDVAAWLRLGEGVSPHDHLAVWMKRGTPQNLARARKVRDGDISRGLLDCPELAEQTFSIMDANPAMGLPAAYRLACDGWRVRGSWSPETAARDWCREGITTPERMHEWLDAGIKDNRFAGAFTRLGITPQQCKPWADMSATDRIRLPSYLAAGYTPDTLPGGLDTRNA